jgi:hypothetical protein
VKRAFSVLLCSIAIGFAAPRPSALAPQRPQLYLPKYTQRGDASLLEWPVTVCEKMPAADLKEVDAWLSSGEWLKGARAIPKIPVAGCFAFLQPGTEQFWVVWLVADARHIFVELGTAAGHGFITVQNGSLRCVENTRIGEILRRQVDVYYPAGVQRIEENYEVMDKKWDPRLNADPGGETKPPAR